MQDTYRRSLREYVFYFVVTILSLMYMDDLWRSSLSAVTERWLPDTGSMGDVLPEGLALVVRAYSQPFNRENLQGFCTSFFVTGVELVFGLTTVAVRIALEVKDKVEGFLLDGVSRAYDHSDVGFVKSVLFSILALLAVYQVVYRKNHQDIR